TNTADGAGDNLTIAQAGAFSSGLILSSTGTTATAIVMSTSAGGIDITVAGAAAGENLDLLSNEGITIASTKAMATGVLIYGNAEGGGVRIQGGDTLATAISNGNDIELLTEDDIFIRATDDVSISTLSTGGVIDIASPGFNDVSSTHTINIGGVNADATDTINIATDATQGDVITIGNSTASTTIAITGGNDWSVTVGGTATFRLGHAGATSAVCHTNNAIEVAVISDCDGGASADYAERYPTAEGVGYGDIVVPGSKMVTTRDNSQGEQQIAQAVLSSEAYQGPVYGVVSNNYGDFTSAGNNVPESENPMSVALVGRVPVKVTDENGSIVVGDFLATSSTPGRAMKATQAGRVIGMALADWNGEKDTVMVQVINTWYQPPASQANDLQGGDASITNVTNVNQVVASDGNFAGSVTVAEHLYGSRDMAGRVRIKAGDDKVRVTFEKEYAHLPIVTFSLRSDELVPGRVWVSDEDTTGFTINHSAGSTTSYDLEFNWIAVGVEDAIVTISDGTTEDLTVTVLPTVEPEAPAVEESVAPESTVEPEAPAVEESVAPESTVEPEAPAVEESVAPESAQDSPAGETAG
ncbi:hypothetical protein HZA85_00365, partial [Candidatus Uhrbacteria bacterium]|nr:hypothetical protein [Candidatus Uhrbacteria bacterium]